MDTSGQFRYISLSLAFLDLKGSRAPWKHPDGSGFVEAKAIEYAEWFVNTCKDLKLEAIPAGAQLNVADIRKNLPFTEHQLLKMMRANGGFISNGHIQLSKDILTSCLIFGVKWMQEAYVPYFSESFDKEALRNAYHEVFDTFDCKGRKQMSKFLRTSRGRQAANLLLSYIFSLWVIGQQLEIEQLGVHRLQTESGAQGLVFIPKLAKPDALKVVIPEVLLHDDYKGLARVWLLLECTERENLCWTLLGKTRLVGEISGICKDVSASSVEASQKVYGTSKEILDSLRRYVKK
jgi:hypothetical protein